jgi:hypothetical protein
VVQRWHDARVPADKALQAHEQTCACSGGSATAHAAVAHTRRTHAPRRHIGKLRLCIDRIDE